MFKCYCQAIISFVFYVISYRNENNIKIYHIDPFLFAYLLGALLELIDTCVRI